MLDEGSCSEAEPFALQVHGDSMEPEFKHGCIIVVDPAGVLKNECFVVAKNADGLIFRQLIIDGDRCILRPLNPVYDEEEIAGLHMVTGLVTQQPGFPLKTFPFLLLLIPLSAGLPQTLFYCNHSRFYAGMNSQFSQDSLHM